jgi:hypothetical protein
VKLQILWDWPVITAYRKSLVALVAPYDAEVHLSDMSVTIYQLTQRNVSEDLVLRCHDRCLGKLWLERFVDGNVCRALIGRC